MKNEEINTQLLIFLNDQREYWKNVYSEIYDKRQKEQRKICIKVQLKNERKKNVQESLEKNATKPYFLCKKTIFKFRCF